jgi:hypothetical protein
MPLVQPRYCRHIFPQKKNMMRFYRWQQSIAMLNKSGITFGIKLIPWVASSLVRPQLETRPSTEG